MTSPVESFIQLPDSSANTGHKIRTHTRVVGPNTVHEYSFVQRKPRREAFRSCMFGAVYSGFAAGTATAGHIYAFRWASTTHACRIKRIQVERQVLVGFTAAQEFATALYRLTGYTASHAGGTSATLTSPNCKKDTDSADTKVTSIMITSGSALTAGTHTLDVQPFAANTSWDAAAAASVLHGGVDSMIDYTNLEDDQLIFRLNQGFIVRNEILMGAGGTVRPIVTVDWEEILLEDLEI